MTSFATRSLALAIAALAAGCAADSASSAAGAAPKAPAEYRTGSNIPVRDSRPVSEAERERAKADLDEVRRAGGVTK